MSTSNMDEVINYYNNNNIDAIDHNTIISRIKFFREEYSDVLISYYKCIDERRYIIDDFDFVLSCYSSAIKSIISRLFEFEKLVHDNDIVNMGICYQLKMLFNDIVAMRNFSLISFEGQYMSILRDLVEKIRLLLLSIYDTHYSEMFILNVDNLNEKDRFYKIYSQRAVKKYYEENKIKLNEDVFQYVFGDSIDKRYSLYSWFVHSDIHNIIGYNWNIEKGIDLSIGNNKSSNLDLNSRYGIEMLLWNYMPIFMRLLNKDEKIKQDPSLVVAFLEGLIPVYYNK